MARPKKSELLPEFFQSDEWLAWCKCEVAGVKQSGKMAGIQRSIGGKVQGAVKDAIKHGKVADMAAALTQVESSARAVVALGPALSSSSAGNEVHALIDAAAGVHLVVFESLKQPLG